LQLVDTYVRPREYESAGILGRGWSSWGEDQDVIDRWCGWCEWRCGFKPYTQAWSAWSSSACFALQW